VRHALRPRSECAPNLLISPVSGSFAGYRLACERGLSSLTLSTKTDLHTDEYRTPGLELVDEDHQFNGNILANLLFTSLADLVRNTFMERSVNHPPTLRSATHPSRTWLRACAPSSSPKGANKPSLALSHRLIGVEYIPFAATPRSDSAVWSRCSASGISLVGIGGDTAIRCDDPPPQKGGLMTITWRNAVLQPRSAASRLFSQSYFRLILLSFDLQKSCLAFVVLQP
jgi:hypothetical protein